MSVAEIKAEIQKLTPQEQEELRDALEVVVSGRPKEPRTKGDFDPVAKPIWEIAEEIGTSVPPNDWEKFPRTVRLILIIICTGTGRPREEGFC
jgi:hypothetical protein